MSSQLLQDGVDAQLPAAQRGVANSRISARTAFYLATQGGARSLGLQTGQIQPGYAADLQIVTDRYAPLVPGNYSQVLDRLLYHTTPAEVTSVYVRGNRVHHIPTKESM